jgi:hypothetical protein
MTVPDLLRQPLFITRSMKSSIIKIQRLYLAICAITLIPIAISYGFIPEGTLNLMFGMDMDVEDLNLVHMLRGLMGLYLSMVIFWLVGASNPKFTKAALNSLIFFMYGVAGGRLFSFFFDGIPFWNFIFYFFGELFFGTIGLILINKKKQRD